MTQAHSKFTIIKLSLLRKLHVTLIKNRKHT